MTVEEFRSTFYEYYVKCEENGEDDYKEIVNNFCNLYATSFEEYTAMWEILMDGIEN